MDIFRSSSFTSSSLLSSSSSSSSSSEEDEEEEEEVASDDEFSLVSVVVFFPPSKRFLDFVANFSKSFPNLLLLNCAKFPHRLANAFEAFECTRLSEFEDVVGSCVVVPMVLLCKAEMWQKYFQTEESFLSRFPKKTLFVVRFCSRCDAVYVSACDDLELQMMS
jgi:hypothetical protein